MRAWYKAVKHAGISGNLRFHDLRHTVGTRLIRAGMDIYAVASVLDHSQLSTAKRYAGHNTESIVQSLDRKDNFHDSFTLTESDDTQVNVSS